MLAERIDPRTDAALLQTADSIDLLSLYPVTPLSHVLLYPFTPVPLYPAPYPVPLPRYPTTPEDSLCESS